MSETQNIIGQYASVGNLTRSPITMHFKRGYGNIIRHTLTESGSLTTAVKPWNRLLPLSLPFGGGVSLPPVNSGETPMFDPATTIAWIPNQPGSKIM
jgi:hypothetical protein